MTRIQKQIVLALAILIAITRWWALSASMWDWDEALFALAVRSFDVVEHRPHPPGFPLYILFAKGVNALVSEEFRALQAINLVAGSLLLPALLFLARELGFSFATALGGALITAFAPNVWFFGGTAFSDVPSLALVAGASALLLASRRRGARWFVLGSAALGIAAGVRPQNLLIGLVPFALAAWPCLRTRRWIAVLSGTAVMMAIVVGSYVGAGLASYSWAEYQLTLKDHREYIVTTDSFRSTIRPPLHKLFDDFFIRQFQFFRAGVLVLLLSIVSCFDAAFRLRKPPLVLLVMFGPFAIAAWLTLDFNSVNRFSIGYIPLFAILAADGIGVLARMAIGREKLREAVIAAGSALLALGMAIWAAPAIAEARDTVSPPVAAARWIREHLPPAVATLYVTKPMFRIAEYLLDGYRITRVLDERAVPLRQSEAANAYVLAEGATEEPSGFNFLRSRRSRLWRIARKRYFEISVIPLARRAQFLDGWYEMENEGAETWRWMGARSVTILPPQLPPAELRINLGVPLDAVPIPTITLTLNGGRLDQFRGSSRANRRAYRIRDSQANRPNELRIETDQWVNPKQRGISDDARDLGLRLNDMSWGPAVGRRGEGARERGGEGMRRDQ